MFVTLSQKQIFSQSCLNDFKPTVCVKVKHIGVNALNICTTFESRILAQKHNIHVAFNRTLCVVLVIVILFSTNLPFYVNCAYSLSLADKFSAIWMVQFTLGCLPIIEIELNWTDSLNDREEHYSQSYILHGVDEHTFDILKNGSMWFWQIYSITLFA